jgi:uncharacterized membrane protein (UPF0136 family)
VSIGRLLFRFGIVYGLLLITGGLVLSYFEAKSNSGLNTGILIGSVMWVCQDFAKRNRRYFTPGEKTKVVLGLLAVDVVLQLLLGMAALASVGIGFTALLLGLLFVAVMHGILIYVGVGLMKKPLLKQGVIDEA